MAKAKDGRNKGPQSCDSMDSQRSALPNRVKCRFLYKYKPKERENDRNESYYNKLFCFLPTSRKAAVGFRETAEYKLLITGT